MSVKTAEKKQSRELKPELTPEQLITELRNLRAASGWVPMHYVDALLAAHNTALARGNEILNDNQRLEARVAELEARDTAIPLDAVAAEIIAVGQLLRG